MIAIDEYAYRSKIAGVDPKGKLMFSLIPLCICLCMNSVLVSILTIVLMAAACVKCGRLSVKKYVKLMLIPVSFLMLGAVTIIINRYQSDSTLIVGITVGKYAYGIDRTSLIKGIKLILRALGAVSCMYFLSLNTPMVDLFSFLRRTKLPELVISLMELIYRYIFVLWEEAERMRTAQKSRLGDRGFITSVRAMGSLISNLFMRAFARCDRAYTALEARGFDGTLGGDNENFSCPKAMYLHTAWVSLVLIAAGLLQYIV